LFPGVIFYAFPMAYFSRMSAARGHQRAAAGVTPGLGLGASLPHQPDFARFGVGGMLPRSWSTQAFAHLHEHAAGPIQARAVGACSPERFGGGILDQLGAAGPEH
jgi:hypothetical protein